MEVAVDDVSLLAESESGPNAAIERTAVGSEIETGIEIAVAIGIVDVSVATVASGSVAGRGAAGVSGRVVDVGPLGMTRGRR